MIFSPYKPFCVDCRIVGLRALILHHHLLLLWPFTFLFGFEKPEKPEKRVSFNSASETPSFYFHVVHF